MSDTESYTSNELQTNPVDSDIDIIDLENEFLKDCSETGRFILSIGSKGSGKTHIMLSFLKWAISNKIYDAYHLCFPMYLMEQNDSYSFLKDQMQCKIYLNYSEKLVNAVLKDREKFKVLFIIDDSTAELYGKIDPRLIKLSTTTRHGAKGCTAWLIFHSAKKCMTPLIRQQMDHLFLYKISDVKLLEGIFDEYLSMYFINFKSFKKFYLQTMKEKYGCMFYSIHFNAIDPRTKNWHIVKSSEQLKLKSNKTPKIPTGMTFPDEKIKNEKKRITFSKKNGITII